MFLDTFGRLNGFSFTAREVVCALNPSRSLLAPQRGGDMENGESQDDPWDVGIFYIRMIICPEIPMKVVYDGNGFWNEGEFFRNHLFGVWSIWSEMSSHLSDFHDSCLGEVIMNLQGKI